MSNSPLRTHQVAKGSLQQVRTTLSTQPKTSNETGNVLYYVLGNKES